MAELDSIFLETEEKMKTSLKSYNINLSKITVGRASPQILSSIKVDYYGSQMPVLEIANVSIPDARQLLIKPYDAKIIKNIVGVINSASLGITANDEGNQARIIFPEVTTERRKELIKFFSKYTEQAKIAVRTARQNANKLIKKINLSEEEEKNQLDKMQELTDSYIQKIDDRSLQKEADLMAI